MRSTMTSPFVLLGLILTATTLSAKEPAPGGPAQRHYIHRSTGPIVVDGTLDELAWRDAWSMELGYEVQPGENVPPPVRTEVLVTWDADAVYFGFRAFDPSPQDIRAFLTDRDNVGSDDWVAVILDTFNDERRSFDLFVNPLGVQTDMVETQATNEEWDAIWDSAGRITDWGWVAELRVPFASLRFQQKEGPQVWGFDAVRSYPRTVRHHIGLFPRDRSNNCYLCQAVKIEGFEGAKSGNNLEVAPTITSTRTDSLTDVPGGTLIKGSPTSEFGLTARWGVSPAMTLSGTYNPDFSQVEADALQLDVNEPFAIFYPEKRPFFLEGTDFFSTPLEVIYTRTMREPAWGAKLTGKQSGNTVGAYVVQDELTNLLFPGSQESDTTTLEQRNTSAVLRYKRDVGSELTLGALVTDREGEAYYNRVAGFDGEWKPTETDMFRLQVLGSATRYPGATASEFGQPTGELRDLSAEFLYLHETRTWDYWAWLRDLGDDFRADLGFLPQVDYRLAEAGAGYTWNSDGSTWYSALRAETFVRHVVDQQGNLLYDRTYAIFSYEGALQSHAYAQVDLWREAYNGVEFDRRELNLHNCMSPGGGTDFFVNFTFGDKIDYDNTRLGRRLRVSPGITQRLGRHLSVELSGAWERMREASQELYTAAVARATLAYQFNTRAFVRAVLQYSSYDYNLALYDDDPEDFEEGLFTQLLFAYKLNPQSAIYVGYSDASQGTQDYSLTRTDRTFFVKAGYAFLL
jgi:hypothetical protein